MRPSRILPFLPALLLSFAAPDALAYPEMIRNGYVNCVSCHISPNGGSVLSDYGRSFVREELAIWKTGDDETNREHLFAYGAIADTSVAKWLKGGGDVRVLYLYRDDAIATQTRTLLMQADVAGAAVLGKTTLVAAVGAVRGRDEVEFGARELYAMYTADDYWRIRAGRFVPAYGINTPDHITLTRDPIRISTGFETDNVELSRIDERWNVIATGRFGRVGGKSGAYDQGFALQASYATSERVRFGLNTLYGNSDIEKRWLYGGFGLFGITEELFASTEVDYIQRVGRSDGLATTQKVSYELRDGLWVYGLQEYGRSALGVTGSETEVYGLGFQIFPRAHFEFNVAYERRRQPATQADAYDYAWLMSHFYL